MHHDSSSARGGGWEEVGGWGGGGPALASLGSLPGLVLLGRISAFTKSGVTVPPARACDASSGS